MYLDYIVLSVLLALCFLNFLILFFVSAFLVRFRIDLMTLFDSLFSSKEKGEEPKIELTKTWDEKYENEMESIARRIRQNADGDF